MYSLGKIVAREKINLVTPFMINENFGRKGPPGESIPTTRVTASSTGTMICCGVKATTRILRVKLGLSEVYEPEFLAL